MSTTESTNPTNPQSQPLPVATTGTPAAPKPAAADATEKRMLDFYRPEDGHRPRGVIGVALAVLLLYGCHAFYEWLPSETFHKPLSGIGTLLGDEFQITGAVVLAGLLAVGVLVGIYKLLNWPRFVDFLIDTESELKKVSWASKRQVVSESIVVVVTLLIVGVYVFMVDTVLIFVRGRDWNSFWSKIF